jgi:N-methylhydantoinase B
VVERRDQARPEHNAPLLHVWRREAPDSGGAGRFRGGNGIEYALAVHDTGELALVLGTHGVVVPNNIGVFGAYPGGCGDYEHVAGADWRERMAAGEVSSDVKQLGGDYRIPEAKTRFMTGGSDVINQWTENAGGFGDPLERDVERVVDDVLDGQVTRRETAQRIYGVVLDGDEAESKPRRRSATGAARPGSRTWRTPGTTTRPGSSRSSTSGVTCSSSCAATTAGCSCSRPTAA